MLQLRHVLLGRAFLRERPRQHEFGLEDRITALHPSIERRPHPAQDRVADLALDVDDHLAGIGLIPAPVQVFGCQPKLDDEVARQVLRLDFAPFFAPEADQGGFVITHDDPGVRAANEVTAGVGGPCPRHRFHGPFSSKMAQFSLVGLWH